MKTGTKHKRSSTILTLCLCVAALFWVKLKLVRNLPRTAYAEPEAAHPEPTPPDPIEVPGDHALDHDGE